MSDETEWTKHAVFPYETASEDRIRLVGKEETEEVQRWARLCEHGLSCYEISTWGLLRSHYKRRPHILSPCLPNGYPAYGLIRDDKKHVNRAAHRLVALAFKVMPGDCYRTVDHVNRDRFDCRATNLEWKTNAEQCLNQKERKRLAVLCLDAPDGRVLQRYSSIDEAAYLNGITVNGINGARRKGCKAGGWHWAWETPKEPVNPSIDDRVVPGWAFHSSIGDSKVFVTPHGRIYMGGGKVYLTEMDNVGGYRTVNIRTRKYQIHRLVCAAWNDPPPSCGEKGFNISDWVVDHKNAVKTDNRPDNLRWLTHKENTRAYHALKRKRDAEEQ